MLILSPAPLDVAALYEEFLGGVGDAGAVATFLGRVRINGDQEVRSLFLDYSRALTSTVIEEALAGAIERFTLVRALVAHRVGEIKAGDPIVFVATAATHRRAAFEACDFLMDFLKTDAPFWKKQNSRGGNEWIEPRAEDYADRKRWR